MKLACFYHCWADGSWQAPLVEHLAAVEASGFDGPMFLGVTGGRAQRERVKRVWDFMARPATVVVDADAGFEQPTIDAVRDYALANGGAVMYAHTKGAAQVSPFNVKWRRAMTLRVISRWRENLALLDGGADAVGCHWLTPPEFSTWGCDRPFFGGNFWMARCDYLRTLPPCSNADRFEAEAWIGLGSPNAVNLRPGWPAGWCWPEQHDGDQPLAAALWQ